MTGAQSTQGPTVGHGNRWPTATVSLAVGVVFFAWWFWLLPRWLGFNRVIAAVTAVALGVHLFVIFYEESTLRKKFGAEYDGYRATSVAGGRVCRPGISRCESSA